MSTTGSGFKAPRKPRQPFTQKEDEKLKQLVESLGDSDWTIISKCMENRTPRQCRDRWKEYLMPTLNTSDWTPEEDNILRQKIKEYGKKWAIVCISLNGRSETSAKNRWRLLERRQLTKKVDHVKVDHVSSPETYETSPKMFTSAMEQVQYFNPPTPPACYDYPPLPVNIYMMPPQQPTRMRFPSLMEICPHLVCF